MFDLYSILELTPSATAEEIKAAYKRLAKKYHPDRNPGDATAEDAFKELNRAYQILSDAAVRGRYDEWAKQPEREEAQPHQTDRRYRRNPNYTPPPPSPPAKPPMKYGEIAAWLGGSIFLFGVFILGLMSFLAKHDAKLKYEAGYAAYFVEGSEEKAISLLGTSIYRDAEYAPAYLLMAEIMLQTKKYTAALHNYEKGMAFASQLEAKHYLGKATALNELGKQTEAYQELLRSFTLTPAPSDWEARQMAGNIALYHEYRYDEAIQHFKEVLKANPNRSQALLGLGIALHHTQQYAQSNEKLLQVNMQEPAEGKVLYYLGMNQLLGAQDTVSACRLLEGAISLGVMESRWVMINACGGELKKSK